MLPFVSLLVWHEDVQESGEQKPKSGAKKHKVGDNKTEDVDRVVSKRVELRVRKAEDNRKNRRGDVAEERGPERRDGPVLLPCEDDHVEIAAQLVALFEVSIDTER